jgi:two-component system, NarL family, response regulator NreC
VVEPGAVLVPGRDNGGMPGPIRIQICDDHAIVRAGLHVLLESEPDITVIGEAASADEAIDGVRSGKPDVLLLDIVMPGRSGIEALPEIRAAAPDTRVLMLSMQDDPAYVRGAFAAGAHGYLLKDAADSDLVEAIHDVAAGRRYVHPSLGAKLATAQAGASEGSELDKLSEREREVLRLLALGHTNQEIANLMFLSIRTGETHRGRIVQKLGLRTRAEIVSYMLAAGGLGEPRSSAA